MEELEAKVHTDMMTRCPPRSALLDLAWMALGLLFVLMDLFLDLWVTYYFIVESKHFLALLYVCFLVISSSTQQLFSFCWVLDDKNDGPVHRYILVIHLLHLGLIWRYVRYLKLRWTIGIEGIPTTATSPMYQSSLEQADDIGILRVFDTFLEHTPQLVLLLTNSDCTTIKLSYALGMTMSFFSISWMLLDHKRTMCKSQGNESKLQGLGCCTVYLLFNLLLVTPRVVSIALYVSSVKYYIISHLAIELILMLIFCYFMKTDFTTSRIMEWIYRLVISICLIYTWFNVMKGPTKRYRVTYHCFIIIDTSSMLTLAWWFWKSEHCPHGGFVVIVVASAVAASYMLGLVITCAYYKWKKYPLPRCVNDEIDGVPMSSQGTAAVRQCYRRLHNNTSNSIKREEFF
uniref:XK-related protein 8-like isoform X2 n=1 Tax=Myxine glutinosa TaxID=7769 RepID=UPI00358E52D9